MNDLDRYMKTIGLLTTIVAVFTAGALATPVPMLDQSQELSNGGSAFYYHVSLAQTFTPAIAGHLDHVDLHIEGFEGADTRPATIAIVNTNAGTGAPSGAWLGSVVAHPLAVGWNTIDFSSQLISLNIGTTYGIYLWNNDLDKDSTPTDAWRIQWDEILVDEDLVNPYPQGALWERTRLTSGDWGPWALAVFDDSSPPGVADGAFRTYMVPEPTTLALMLLAGLGFVKSRKSRWDTSLAVLKL